jgi:hypothetical protein
MIGVLAIDLSGIWKSIIEQKYINLTSKDHRMIADKLDELNGEKDVNI